MSIVCLRSLVVDDTKHQLVLLVLVELVAVVDAAVTRNRRAPSEGRADGVDHGLCAVPAPACISERRLDVLESVA